MVEKKKTSTGAMGYGDENVEKENNVTAEDNVKEWLTEGSESVASDSKRSKFSDIKILLQLVPRQLSDEVELAKKEFLDKGKTLGVSVMFFGVALVVFCSFFVGVVVALIAAIALVVPLWLSALLISAFFLIIIVIFVLLGVKKAKAIAPIIPEEALRGMAIDYNILRQGGAFDETEYDQRQEQKRVDKKQAKEEAKQKENDKHVDGGHPEDKQHNARVSHQELVARTHMRREHMTALRDSLRYGRQQTGVKKTRRIHKILRKYSKQRQTKQEFSEQQEDLPWYVISKTSQRNLSVAAATVVFSGACISLLIRFMGAKRRKKP